MLTHSSPLRGFHPIFYCKHGSGYSTVRFFTNFSINILVFDMASGRFDDSPVSSGEEQEFFSGFTIEEIGQIRMNEFCNSKCDRLGCLKGRHLVLFPSLPFFSHFTVTAYKTDTPQDKQLEPASLCL